MTWKAAINENVSFTDRDHVSGIRLLSCYKLTINWEYNNDVTICRHDVIVRNFWRCRVFLVKFSYWSKFHVSIVTGSGVMKISWKFPGNRKHSHLSFAQYLKAGGELGIPNLVWISLMKRVTAFIVSKLIKIKNEILADEKHAQSQQQWYFRNLFKVSNKDTRTCLKQHRSGFSLFVNFK